MKCLNLANSKFEPRDGYERSVVFTTADFSGDTKLQLMRLAPGHAIKPHHHQKRTECFKIISGKGQIKVNGEVVASTNDEMVLCQPGDVHEFINPSGSEPLVVMVIRTNDPGNADMIWD